MSLAGRRSEQLAGGSLPHGLLNSLARERQDQRNGRQRQRQHHRNVQSGLNPVSPRPDQRRHHQTARGTEREHPCIGRAWRGRGKDELLAGLRARRRGVNAAPDAGKSEPTETISVPEAGQFGWPAADPDRATAPHEANAAWPWGREEDLATIEIRPRLAVASDLILRQLDPTPLPDDGVLIIEALRPLYDAITGGAAALVLDEPAPVDIHQAPRPDHTTTST